ncbi:glycosyltransferase family 39 protein [bacterium]|nr:glycosyltransferase family 39 protein [bacterium]
MNKNIFFKLLILCIIALLLRSWHLDKPEGLWNDEYVAWYIASQNDFISFVSAFIKNCHMPVYYLFLKFWLFIFPDTDLNLRISSVVCSLCSIPVMYLAGKEAKDEKTGLLTAAFTVISSFLIYFAQEVRIYSLLFLFTSLSLLFWIKCYKNFTRKNLIYLLLSNFLIIFTHTIGIVFVTFNIFALLILKFREKAISKMQGLFISLPYLVVIFILSLILLKLSSSHTLSQFWATFNWSKVYYVFSDFLSPVQINIINTPKNLLQSLFHNSSLSIAFIIFSVIPTVLSLFLIFKALFEKNKAVKYYALSCLMFFAAVICAAIGGKIVLITKYCIEIYPFLILGIVLGLTTLKKPLMIILTSLLMVLNLSYIIISPNSAPKMTRDEGNYAPVALIQNAGLTKNDIIVLTYYDKHFFERYMDTKKYNIVEITKYSYPYFLFDSGIKNIIRDTELEYFDYFNENDTKFFAKSLKNNILDKMKPGEKIAFIFLNNVSFYSEKDIYNITQNIEEYKKTPFIFLVFSYLKNNLIKQAERNGLKLILYTDAGAWSLISFEKE